MDPKKVAEVIATCLNQKVNFDHRIDDTGREWWYVSPLYLEGQQVPISSVDELADKIKSLKLKSIKGIETFTLFKRLIIQIRGSRLDIIKECEDLIKK